MRVHVVPHDPHWCNAFNREKLRIAVALGNIIVQLHHIGSTAIPGICAKPITDMLLEVTDVDELDGRNAVMVAHGYEALGEYGIPGRRFFRKHDDSGMLTHHMHAFRYGDIHVERHIAFRDYMIAHPEAAHEYGALKQKLAQAHRDDREAYMQGKDSFIKKHESMAIAWRLSQPKK